jgi:uncharacterized RDD family membrane protein YckC
VSQTPATWQPPETPAGPAPGIELASPGARLVGYVIDIVIQFVAFIALAVSTILLAVIFFPLAILTSLAIIALAIGYFPFFWVRSGQTPGMSIMGIKVVRDDNGGPITWGPAILRWIGFYISHLVFYIGFLWIFVDERRRGWMDLIGGTVVIAVPPPPYTADSRA